jgi:Putative Flp pilus-assembly TadE/G-like
MCAYTSWGGRLKGDRGWRASRRWDRGERGQVAVFFALLIPTFLALSTIVLDVGNMYVHKRNLQSLVDAGAFAGATKFVGCSYQFGDPAGANQGIRDTALQYAGDTFRDPDTHNRQVQKPGDVRVVLNSDRYWAEGDPMDGVGFDDTIDPDGNPGTPGDPCSTKTLDVKATDHDVPLLTGLIPIRPDAKSKARVEIRQIIEQAGMLPWAVPEVDPAAVVALFVNEDSGAVLAGQRLSKMDDPNLPFLEWATSPPGDPYGVSKVDLQTENTGVVVLVSKIDPMPSVGGSLSQICAQSPGLVKCYAGSGNQDGLTFIHGWSDANGTPDAPVVRDVSVINQTCEDLSAPYFLMTGDCELGVRAILHFGNNPLFNPQTAVVRLFAPGCNSRNGCAMTYSGAAGEETIWTTTQYARFSDDFFGRSSFSIRVTTVFPSGQTHEVTFSNVAHPYVAAPAVLQGNQAPPAVEAGPVEYVKLTTADPGILDANSRNTGDPALASVIVTVGIRRPFQVEEPLVAPVVLRVASPSGSQNQAFDCDTGVNFQNEIQSGCQTTYRENYGDWDHDGISEWRDILCADYPNGAGLPPPTVQSSPAPDCVRVEPGDKIGQFRQGLTARLKNPSCTPNNWPEDPADFQDFFRTYDFANDPRYVTLIVTDFGAFSSQGSSQAVPVKYFAGFYITGWDKTGNNPECADNEPHPWYPAGYRKSLDNGDVWGHFINVVVFSSSGQADDELCNFDEVGTCIAVLVE